MIANRLNWYLESKNLLSSQQSGFRQLHSTNEQVLRLSEDIKQSFNNKQDVLAVFIDFQAAYDTVWRHNLLNKLHNLSITGNMFRWITNFITQRFCATKYNNVTSKFKQTHRGIPQGTVLSTTLFNIYVNDLPQVLENANIKVALFADD